MKVFNVNLVLAIFKALTVIGATPGSKDSTRKMFL